MDNDKSAGQPGTDPADELQPLFTAMENHGNDEGTETQLEDANEFLRAVYRMLPLDRRLEFMRSDEVKVFLETNGGERE